MGEEAETLIRERAYLLWQKEGCPDRRDREFWERAPLLLEAESAPPMLTSLQARSAGKAAVAQTFPTSDPPAFAATARVGASSEQLAPGLKG